MQLLSYNLEKNKACVELDQVVRNAGADVACLQEATVCELPEKVGDLQLIAGTEHNRLGLAIYADPRYQVAKIATRGFKRSIHDMVAAPAKERLLAAELTDEETGETTVVASFHASPLTSTNYKRRIQIRESLGTMELLGADAPLVMAGDYNYPVFRHNLEQRLTEWGYDVTFANGTTYRRGPVSGHFDFVASKGLDVESVSSLPQSLSDHHPILIRARVHPGHDPQHLLTDAPLRFALSNR